MLFLFAKVRKDSGKERAEITDELNAVFLFTEAYMERRENFRVENLLLFLFS